MTNDRTVRIKLQKKNLSWSKKVLKLVATLMTGHEIFILGQTLWATKTCPWALIAAGTNFGDGCHLIFYTENCVRSVYLFYREEGEVSTL